MEPRQTPFTKWQNVSHNMWRADVPCNAFKVVLTTFKGTERNPNYFAIVQVDDLRAEKNFRIKLRAKMWAEETARHMLQTKIDELTATQILVPISRRRYKVRF